MKNSTKIILFAIGIALVAFGLGNWFANRKTATDLPREEIVQTAAPPQKPLVEAPKPLSHYPVNPDTDAQASALPALQVSDTAIRNALVDLLGAKTVLQFFNPSEIIRRIVVSIDNLPRENVSVQTLPLKPPGGQFQVKQNDKVLILDQANFHRYTPYIEVLQHLDAKKLVSLYKTFYPLFQQQYRELGYPDGYFNDRLVYVIDYLINAKDVSEPVQLVQKHVQYQYADPDLEKMSAGQKLLTRMGQDNAAKVKDKLREIRAELTK